MKIHISSKVKKGHNASEVARLIRETLKKNGCINSSGKNTCRIFKLENKIEFIAKLENSNFEQCKASIESILSDLSESLDVHLSADSD